MNGVYTLPRISPRLVPVWRRNFLVWRKLAVPSMLGNLGDPLIYMLGLGYGLGSFLPEVGGVSYIVFLAAGTVCFSVMNSATFEALYSAYSRMAVQKTSTLRSRSTTSSPPSSDGARRRASSRGSRSWW